MKTNQSHLNIKKLFIDGAAWTFIGFGLSQIIRLLSSILLARLLSPQDYGLISIVTVIFVGIGLMSDIGISQNILQSNRADDEDFLNAAWSLQVVKGWIVWLVCILVAWPASVFYEQPILFPLIIVSTFSSVIGSYNSSGVYTTERSVDLKQQTIYQVLSQAIALVVMLIIANIHPTVWALVAGGLTSTSIYAYLTHKLVPMKNKFHWDKEIIHSLIHFGKWILVSSTLGFIVGHSSSLILGKFLTMTELGLFSIGVTLSRVVETIHSTITSKVIMPVHSKIKHLDTHERRLRLVKLKLVMMALFLPVLWFLTLFAADIVSLIFDERYQGAGWILQLYSIAYIPTVISGLGSFYVIMGDTKLLANLTITKTIIFFATVFFGWKLNGANGIIIGIALSTVLNYFVELYAQRVYGVWLAKIDFVGFITSAAVIGFGFYYTNRMETLLQHFI
jgi:O-antigen/teichoic acid export membrane protein